VDSGRDFAGRVANLQGYRPRPALNGRAFLISEGVEATVFDDPYADVLTGASGRDWSLLDAQEDVLTNLAAEMTTLSEKKS
jgi:hypothetical protein